MFVNPGRPTGVIKELENQGMKAVGLGEDGEGSSKARI